MATCCWPERFICSETPVACGHCVPSVDLQSSQFPHVTALSMASVEGNVECVKLLLAAGADATHAEEDGTTAFEMRAGRATPRLRGSSLQLALTRTAPTNWTTRS